MHNQSTALCIEALAQNRAFAYAPRMTRSTLSQNIAALRKHLGMNQEQFGEAVGSAQTNVTKWEGKGIVPSAAPLARMAELAECSVSAFVDRAWAPRSGRDMSSGRAPTASPATDDNTVEITSLDLSLSMGPGTLIEEFVEAEPVKFDLALVQSITRTPSDKLRLVKGIGDSMEPTLRTGDRVMVDINEKALARINGIYWIDHLGTHGIKRLRAAGKGRVMIASDNPDVENFEAPADDIRIEGRVIWFAREL